MKMPNRENLYLETSKLSEYLLSSANASGRHKASFFRRFGYNAENINEFAEALKYHGLTQEVTRVVDTPYGTRYNVEVPIDTPDGRNPRIRTVWQIEPGLPGPRLITAFPIRT